ncbi:hypothetical protein [Cellulomonas sp. PhB150]|uniref:hypothetical protein n=1 Tax=Cellulomonas sp. PhB150 TaxID=2485188 RepID=UPI000F4843AD|nr:hypothetical protein [Cellulomonas sp. PhB150]ROS27829.1 hypothetical protein EDF34_1621 [Cellulomonas sp. PhB150]
MDTLRAIRRSPAAGQLFATLDRIATSAADPNSALRTLTDSTLSTDPASDLLGRATAWLHRHSEDSSNLPTVHDADGLDADGWALLRQVEDLNTDRAATLTDSALRSSPAWLEQLGPAPDTADARADWLAAIAAHAAHLDRRPPTASTAPTRTPTLTR